MGFSPNVNRLHSEISHFLITSAVDNTSALFGVQVETLPDGDTPSSVPPEKGSHTEKENWVEKLFLASPAAKQRYKL